jgi:hypothetical protein
MRVVQLYACMYVVSTIKVSRSFWSSNVQSYPP